MNLLGLLKKPKLNDDPKRQALEIFIINYINKIIKFDSALGRSDDNFVKSYFNEIGRSVPDIHKKGCRIFHGAGNIFVYKIEHKLSGWKLSCLHIRGLAQRKIIIQEEN